MLQGAETILIGETGVYHDLVLLFHKLNQEYFGNKVQAEITWGKRSQTLSGRSLKYSIRIGSYHPTKKLTTIHPSLDQARVPRICVERVVHHEMLHQYCPAEKRRGGRRQIHTPEFRAQEALYVHAMLADKWFKDNLDDLLVKKVYFTS